MKDLLEKDFIKHYGVVRMVKVNAVSYNADFTLSDEKACIACVKKGADTACNKHEVVKLGCKEKEAIVIDYEGFINSLAGTKAGTGRKCDNIVYTSDKEKFLLNELTCSQSKYIEAYTANGKDQLGKRATAVKQLNEAISKLCAVPAIDTFIQSFNQNVGLFAYRLKPMSAVEKEQDNKAMEAIRDFLLPLSAIPMIQTDKGLDKGFVFVQMMYPDVYYL